MDLQPRSKPEVTIVSPANVQSAPDPGAFFPHASGFTIGGGVFTSNVNITNHVHSPPQEQLAAFRTILLGDIKLIKELRVNDESGVVGRQNRDARVRRMYSAKVMSGETGQMTVAMYQGARVEAEWRQHLTIYESLRHPNVMQLYGLANTSALRAMVFHDDLIHFDQFIGRFRHSPILTLYIYSYCSSEYHQAKEYFFSVSPSRITSWSSADFTYWIRPASGELCVDFVEGNQGSFGYSIVMLPDKPPRLEDLSLDDPDAEAVITAALDGNQYHALCSSHPMARRRRLAVSTQLPIRPPVIYRSNSQNETCFRITESLRYDRQNPVRYVLRDTSDPSGEVLPNSWTRHNTPLTHRCLWRWANPTEPQPRGLESWLAQANHIFTQLQETTHSEDYVCVTAISFVLELLPNACNTDEPDGYLFVCPSKDFRVGADSFRWPDCPAYWSFDPSGAARLSTQDAKILGFPIIHIETVLYGRSWDSSVYDGLRQFHRGKGFDPDSQEAAIHYGYPLYELPSEVVGPLACVQIKDEYECSQEDPALCQTLGHYL